MIDQMDSYNHQLPVKLTKVKNIYKYIQSIYFVNIFDYFSFISS